MELLHGSPADMTGREPVEVRAYALLDRLGIDFYRTDHPDAPATTMEVCAQVDARDTPCSGDAPPKSTAILFLFMFRPPFLP